MGMVGSSIRVDITTHDVGVVNPGALLTHLKVVGDSETHKIVSFEEFLLRIFVSYENGWISLEFRNVTETRK